MGGGLWVLSLHPEMRISTPYREWNFTGDIVRMPEFLAPALGNRANTVTLNGRVGDPAEGVLYALGGAGGGLTCFVDGGHICYEYNIFLVYRTKIRTEKTLTPGPVTIQIETCYIEPRPGGPLNIVITVNGEEWATGTVPISVPLLFSANDCLDVGTGRGSRLTRLLRQGTLPVQRRNREHARPVPGELDPSYSTIAQTGCAPKPARSGMVPARSPLDDPRASRRRRQRCSAMRHSASLKSEGDPRLRRASATPHFRS